MRRTGYLFERIADRENLRLAFSKALKGKRARHDAHEFAARLDENLSSLAADLSAGTLRVGCYHQFVIHDPKERIITAPCFRERVLHHAIMSVCEPVFERWLIHDTYACRRGKGRIRALLRARHFARREPCFLKLDIRKYFDSIPHDVLLERLARLFKDGRLLDLLERIVAAFRGESGRGLPIGSLTSQHFANFFLGWFDRFVKERLRIRGYVRYMDDMALWGPSSAGLRDTLSACREFLGADLQLQLKPVPFINRTVHGMDFLGCRVFAERLVLNRRSRLRFVRKLRCLESQFACAELSEADLQQRATALAAFTQTPGLAAWRWRTRVLQRLPVSGHEARTG